MNGLNTEIARERSLRYSRATAMICLFGVLLGCGSGNEPPDVADPTWQLFMSPRLKSVHVIVLDEARGMVESAGTRFEIPTTDWQPFEQLFLPGRRLWQIQDKDRMCDLAVIELENDLGEALRIQIQPGGKGGVEYRIGDVLYTQDIARAPRFHPKLDRSFTLLYALTRYENGLTAQEREENERALHGVLLSRP